MPSVKANGIDVYYEVHGEGEPLLLIPGLGNGLSLFRVATPVFAKERKVIALDNRGVGRTDMPDAPYSIEMMADDAAGLLKAIGIERADVLGVSMGGKIAMDFAIRHPEMVRGLILASTSARVTKDSRKGFSFRFGKVLKRATGSWGFKSAQPYYAFRRQLEASTKYDATARLGMIKAPTLIMRGERDSLAPSDLVEELHAGVKGSKLLELKGGHLFFLTRNKEFTQAASEFLKGLG